jgi:HxlR-like helix-turn-helix
VPSRSPATGTVLAERWTPIILRNLLLGSTSFSEIAAGAPGISRTLLTTRLRELERVGVVQTTPSPSGHASEADIEAVAAALRACPATRGSRGLQAAERCAKCGLRRSRVSVAAAISWSSGPGRSFYLCQGDDAAELAATSIVAPGAFVVIWRSVSLLA